MLKIRIFTNCFIDEFGNAVNEYEEMWIPENELVRYKYLEPEVVARKGMSLC